MTQKKTHKKSSLDRHLGNPRIQKLLKKITDTDLAEVVIEVFEDMERTNMKLLQNAADFDELVTCREFAKCTGMFIKKMKRAVFLKKAENNKSSDFTEEMLREIEDDGI